MDAGVSNAQTHSLPPGIAVTAENIRNLGGRIAGLYVTGSNGTLIASADNDINLLAAAVTSAGSAGSPPATPSTSAPSPKPAALRP